MRELATTQPFPPNAQHFALLSPLLSACYHISSDYRGAQQLPRQSETLNRQTGIPSAYRDAQQFPRQSETLNRPTGILSSLGGEQHVQSPTLHLA